MRGSLTPNLLYLQLKQAKMINRTVFFLLFCVFPHAEVTTLLFLCLAIKQRPPWMPGSLRLCSVPLPRGGWLERQLLPRLNCLLQTCYCLISFFFFFLVFSVYFHSCLASSLCQKDSRRQPSVSVIPVARLLFFPGMSVKYTGVLSVSK